MQAQALDLGVRVRMSNQTNRLFCRLDGLSTSVREQKRVTTLKNLGLLDTETIPVFEEAAQTAARFLEAPICFLSLMVQDQLWLKSAFGLSSLGLMNPLATSRRFPRNEAFCTYVVDSHQPLVIEDAIADPVFATSILTQHYGIRAYLGTPLLTTDGQCLGTLAVMDSVPRYFSHKDVEFLSMTARWCLREYEREYERLQLLKNQSNPNSEAFPPNPNPVLNPHQVGWETTPSLDNHSLVAPFFANSTSTIKLKLLEQLTQELRTPLTSVIGMASVLGREVYGTLNSKQKEYLEIIHNSGQTLISLVEEIVNLKVADESAAQLQQSPVDLEMLCQQVINSLTPIAEQQQIELRLSLEPGNRIWLLDKEKVRQSLYYLVISLINSAEQGSDIRIHVSRKQNALNLSVWVSHPWLGDGLHQIENYALHGNLFALGLETALETSDPDLADSLVGNQILTSSALMSALNQVSQLNQKTADKSHRELLGLLLTCHLVELHGGNVIVQGSAESGYRYVLKLPKVAAEEV